VEVSTISLTRRRREKVGTLLIIFRLRKREERLPIPIVKERRPFALSGGPGGEKKNLSFFFFVGGGKKEKRCVLLIYLKQFAGKRETNRGPRVNAKKSM